MKKHIESSIFTLIIMFIALLTHSHAQDALVYPSQNYQGTPVPISIGQSLIGMRLQGVNKSVRILRPCGVYLYNTDGTFIFITSDIPAVQGVEDQYNTVTAIVCDLATRTPQPRRWVPIDGREIPTERPPLSCSTPSVIISSPWVLTVKRAYLWENADPFGCPHGPWGEIRIRVYDGSAMIQDHDYKLVGPIPYSNDKCNFPLGFPEWPSDEWADNGDGIIYSNYGVFDWMSSSLQQVSVEIAEEGTPNLLRFTVNRNDPNIIYSQSNYGFAEVQNVQRPTAEPKLYGGNKYVSPYGVTDGYPELHYPLKGNAQFPYDNLEVAITNTPINGILVLYPGKYFKPTIMTKPMTLISCAGSASIGDGNYFPSNTRSEARPNCGR